MAKQTLSPEDVQNLKKTEVPTLQSECGNYTSGIISEFPVSMLLKSGFRPAIESCAVKTGVLGSEEESEEEA